MSDQSDACDVAGFFKVSVRAIPARHRSEGNDRGMRRGRADSRNERQEPREDSRLLLGARNPLVAVDGWKSTFAGARVQCQARWTTFANVQGNSRGWWQPRLRREGWPANRSSLTYAGERRLVDQNIASWNQIDGWLGQLDLIRSAA